VFEALALLIQYYIPQGVVFFEALCRVVTDPGAAKAGPEQL
jgi:hypothetical protein